MRSPHPEALGQPYMVPSLHMRIPLRDWALRHDCSWKRSTRDFLTRVFIYRHRNVSNIPTLHSTHCDSWILHRTYATDLHAPTSIVQSLDPEVQASDHF